MPPGQVGQTVGRAALLRKHPEPHAAFLLQSHHLKTGNRAGSRGRYRDALRVGFGIGQKFTQAFPRGIGVHPNSSGIGIKQNHMLKVFRAHRNTPQRLESGDGAGGQPDGIAIGLGAGDGHVGLGPGTGRQILDGKRLTQIFFCLGTEGAPSLIRPAANIPADKKLDGTAGVRSRHGWGKAAEQQDSGKQQSSFFHGFLLGKVVFQRTKTPTCPQETKCSGRSQKWRT